jgi:hypothetical protein
VRWETTFPEIPPTDSSNTSPAASGDWRPNHLPPSVLSGGSATDDVFYIDTKGTKPRDLQQLERSAELLTYKLRQVELNKKAESIENDRVRASYRDEVARRTDREVSMHIDFFIVFQNIKFIRD